MTKFGDCTLVEFAALCGRRGIEGADHDNWIRLFKKCANAHGTPKASERQQRIIEIFIEEARTPNELRAPILAPKLKTMPRPKLKSKSKQNKK